jgi:hypothetical protein
MVLGTLVIYCWRLIVGGIAARPISDHLRQVAGLNSAGPRASDFGVLAGFYAAAGALSRVDYGAVMIQVYYRIVRAIGRLMPVLAPWSEREMTVCSHYLAVQLDRCLTHNLACSRRVKSEDTLVS